MNEFCFTGKKFYRTYAKRLLHTHKQFYFSQLPGYYGHKF